MQDPPEKPRGEGLPTITPERTTPPPNGKELILRSDPDAWRNDGRLPDGYGFINYYEVENNQNFLVEDWGRLASANKPVGRWVAPDFKYNADGTKPAKYPTFPFAPGYERFGGRRRKRSTRRTKKRRNGVSRSARRRV